MKLNCSIVEDLLPLYLEDMCSEDSKSAIEEHLRECPDCREKLARMKEGSVIPRMEKGEGERPLADYAKKVKRHRIRVGISVAIICALAACVLSLVYLTVIYMHRTANPIVREIEDGVHNLSASELECAAEEVGQYVFYTNYEMIKVTVSADGDFHGAVMLWDTEDSDSFIRIGEVDEDKNACTFTGLSAKFRYKITCDGLAGATVTVSDGRIVSFWYSLKNLLNELF